MQDNTLIEIFRRAIQAWLATDLPRKSNYAFLGRTILPWTILRRGMSRGPFSSYPQENYEKCHDNKGTNNCIQCLRLHTDKQPKRQPVQRRRSSTLPGWIENAEAIGFQCGGAFCVVKSGRPPFHGIAYAGCRAPS